MTALRSPDANSSSEAFARAILNILEDFGAEKDRLADTQRAILNILEDFAGEKARLEATQRAVMNILEDFDEQKRGVELINAELRSEINDRTQAERALTVKTSQLARSNAELEQFAYVASHDLQEPLRMVSNYVQLFARRYSTQVDEQALKYIGYAVEGAKRMQALIGGLLEYSRVGNSSAEREPEVFDSGACLAQATRDLGPMIEETGAMIVHDPLPLLSGMSGQITQLFQNLLANALKFSRPGVTPMVRVSVIRSSSSHYTFSVADNGIGIEPQYAERIFVIFQRLHTRAEYEGTGIGLSICKKVVERNGGRIWVTSKAGAGATFSFTLPAPPGAL